MNRRNCPLPGPCRVRPAGCELIDLSKKFAPKPWAIAVEKGNRSLLDRLNTAIESLKSNGDIGRLLSEAIANVGK